MASNSKGVRHKSFTYRTGVEWTRGRAGTATSQGKPDLTVSSPPEFKGEAGNWTPEDMLVAAVETCTMTTFLSFAERKGLPVASYRSTAEGLLEFADGSFRFTRITLRPIIAVPNAAAQPAARAILEDAHAKCLIANSVRAEVVVEPTITIEN